eukprot:TRINITY_DN14228_c0_g1_i1.p1 TRINITY_DN14228_c0_g1~~TRINITY_DN14228_c0_g1_i1.p1  ORF type:complete len:1280 (+),score=56.74 TRINITY_DN14228_c0_g1_i1:44-3841(+)
MDHIYQFSPLEFTSLLERVMFDPIFSNIFPDKVERRRIAHVLLRHYSDGKPSFANLTTPDRWKIMLENYIYRFGGKYRNGDWNTQFEILVVISTCVSLHIDALEGLHKELLTSPHIQEGYDATNVNTDVSSEKLRTAEITIFNKDQVYIKFKSQDTLTSEGRNRLTRKFGGDNFLIVKYISPYLSLDDKLIIQSNKFSKPQQDIVNAIRLFNIFSNNDKVPLRPSTISEAIASERRDRYEEYTEVLKKISPALNVAGKTFHFFITTTAGIHQQKFIYSVVDPIHIAQWAFTKEWNIKLSSNPIKYALRLALLNSSSVATLPTTNVRVENDILAQGAISDENPDKVLTDGCGRISMSFATQVREAYNSKDPPFCKVPDRVRYESDGSFQKDIDKASAFDKMPVELPSCYQIRYGGCKGTLVVTKDEHMQGSDIIFSKSMEKFETPQLEEHRILEIMGFSKPSPLVTMNTEIIDILVGCARGSHELIEDYFLKLVGNYLKNHQFLLSNMEEALKYYISNEDSRAIKGLSLGCSLTAVFLSSFYCSTLRPLHIPMPQSCRLYGIADFSSILNPRTVFVQNNGKVVTGKVLLFKEPCFQRSDLCLFDAVNCPELSHLNNVIVFSTKGETSDASLMAGSDLDGDKYVCLWDPELVNNVTEFPPLTQAQENESNTNLNKHFQKDSVYAPKEQEDIFERIRHECLFGAVHSLERCSFADLLNLRLCFVDNLAEKWTCDDFSGKENPMLRIGKLLSLTVDAPKNNTWVPVQSVIDLARNCPLMPDYHQRARKINAIESKSVRGRMIRLINKWIQEQLQLPSSDALFRDHVDAIQILLATSEIDPEGSPQPVLVRVLQKHLQLNNSLYCRVALYSLGYWKLNCDLIKHSSEAILQISSTGLNSTHLVDADTDLAITTNMKRLAYYLQPHVLKLPENHLWRHPNSFKIVYDSMLNLIQKKSIARIQWVHKAFAEDFSSDFGSRQKLVQLFKLCRIQHNSEQSVTTTAEEEIYEMSPEDQVSPIGRIIWAFPNNAFFTPDYYLNGAADHQMKKVFTLNLGEEFGTNKHYVKVIKPFMLNINANPKDVPSMSLEQLKYMIEVDLAGFIFQPGWKSKNTDEPLAASDGLLEEINHCIKYFTMLPPTVIRSSYAWKHEVEAEHGYISNAAAIIALYFLGYGYQWKWDPRADRNVNNSLVPLRLHYVKSDNITQPKTSFTLEDNSSSDDIQIDDSTDQPNADAHLLSDDELTTQHTLTETYMLVDDVGDLLSSEESVSSD